MSGEGGRLSMGSLDWIEWCHANLDDVHLHMDSVRNGLRLGLAGAKCSYGTGVSCAGLALGAPVSGRNANFRRRKPYSCPKYRLSSCTLGVCRSFTSSSCWLSVSQMTRKDSDPAQRSRTGLTHSSRWCWEADQAGPLGTELFMAVHASQRVYGIACIENACRYPLSNLSPSECCNGLFYIVGLYLSYR